MSLDVSLYGPEPRPAGSGIFVRENGETREITRTEWDERFPGREPIVADLPRDEAYSANITHNLGRMAREAGIYEYLWRPEEIGITIAGDLIGPLADGLALLLDDPDRFRKFNPENGWGNYEGLVRFVNGYLTACRRYPTATVHADR